MIVKEHVVFEVFVGLDVVLANVGTLLRSSIVDLSENAAQVSRIAR